MLPPLRRLLVLSSVFLENELSFSSYIKNIITIKTIPSSQKTLNNIILKQLQYFRKIANNKLTSSGAAFLFLPKALFDLFRTSEAVDRLEFPPFTCSRSGEQGMFTCVEFCFEIFWFCFDDADC